MGEKVAEAMHTRAKKLTAAGRKPTEGKREERKMLKLWTWDNMTLAERISFIRFMLKIDVGHNYAFADDGIYFTG